MLRIKQVTLHGSIIKKSNGGKQENMADIEAIMQAIAPTTVKQAKAAVLAIGGEGRRQKQNGAQCSISCFSEDDTDV